MRGSKRAASVVMAMALLFTGIASAASASAQPAGAGNAKTALSGSEDFKEFTMWFDIGELSNTNACIPSWVTARYRDPGSGSDTWTQLVRTNNNGCEADQTHLQAWGDFQNTYTRVNLLGGPKPGQHIHWDQLTSLTLTVTTPNTPPGRQKCVAINREGIWALDTNNYWHELVNQPERRVLCDGHNDFEMFVEH
ncbi:hypothetical protein [Kutzneria sp. 744]|uniref:hypothetical protein n=1 Tax=Kutzneria sp. (strain 744) TaxID=345341 RepID=UPI0004B7E6A1|nr:hypothetical protein [Kutzneria sp. 744]